MHRSTLEQSAAGSQTCHHSRFRRSLKTFILGQFFRGFWWREREGVNCFICL